MFDRLVTWLDERRDSIKDMALSVYESLWFRPICWVFILCTLSMTLILLEWFYVDAKYWDEWFVLWRSQADGAKTMLGAIAGATLTVVSLAFSLMMVVVIQTANAYSPRLLSQFIADRHNHHVLGLLMGSFAYSLLALRSIREEPDFVPHIAVNVALLLSIASIIALISFIQHVAESIQVASIITLIESQTKDVLSRSTERAMGEPYEGDYTLRSSHVVRSTSAGYIRLLESDVMEKLLDRDEIVIEWHAEIGDHVLLGSELATVWHADRIDSQEFDEVEHQIQAVITVGQQRAWFHDLRYGFQQLTDIALKALSPGINDPTTAVMAIHALTKLTSEVIRGHVHAERRANARGELKFIYPERWLERLLMETFWQVMQYGKTDFMVVETLLKSLSQLAKLARAPEHFRTVSECLEGIVDFMDMDVWSKPQRERMSATLREIQTQVATVDYNWNHNIRPHRAEEIEAA